MNLSGLTESCNPRRLAELPDVAVNDRNRKLRLQVYVDPELHQQVKRRAEAGHRPESWELERLIRAGLEANATTGQ